MHTKLQKKSLWLSVEHYLENWQDPLNANISSHTCACCREWANADCVGCPIMQHMGLDDCKGTPWTETYEAYREGLSEDNLREALEAEYRFLVELALEPYGNQGTFSVRFDKGAVHEPYVVFEGQVEVERYHTKWAANRRRAILAGEVRIDGRGR